MEQTSMDRKLAAAKAYAAEVIKRRPYYAYQPSVLLPVQVRAAQRVQEGGR
jgi:hypothetical protein